jgi:hypothetical protein
MGFSRPIAIRALRQTKENNLISTQRAIDWLFIPGNNEEPSNEEEEKKAEENDKKQDEKPQKKLRKRKRKIPIELQLLFSELQLVDKFAVSTNRLTDSFGWGGKDIGQQHDVHELNRLVNVISYSEWFTVY